MLIDTGGPEGSRELLLPVSAPGGLDRGSTEGHLRYTIPEIGTGVDNRLGLIITRLDSEEDSDPVGAYTLILQPGHGP